MALMHFSKDRHSTSMIMARKQVLGRQQLKIGHSEPGSSELAKADAERKERRREQNRRAAQRCRTKKRMSQFSVVKKFEKVVEDNHYLKKEMVTLRRQRDDLKNCIDQYCCSHPFIAKVPDESKLDIKREPAFNEDSANVPITELTSVYELKKDKTMTCNVGSAFPRCRYSSCDQNPTRIKQSSSTTPVNTFQPSEASPDNNQRGRMWQYYDSLFQKQHECAFTSSIPKASVLSHSREQSQEYSPPYRHQQQYNLNRHMHIKDCQNGFKQHSTTTTSNTMMLIANTLNASSTKSSRYPDLCCLLKSNSSSCQIAAANSNHNASDRLPNTRRQSSPSRPSTGTPHTSISDRDNIAFRSVSAEGSFLDNKIVNIQQHIQTREVPDINCDDSFSVTPLNRNHVHDINNNVTRDSRAKLLMGDGISRFERLPIQEAGTPRTVTGRSESDFSMNNGMEIGDVNTLMMEISNDQLLFSNVNRESGSSFDVTRDYMTYIHED